MCLKLFKLYCVGIVLCSILVAIGAAKNLEVISFVSSSKYDKSWIDWKTVRLTKTAPNTFVVIGDATLHYNVGDEQRIEIKVLRKSPLSNTYSVFFSLNKPACKFLSTEETTYPTVVEHSNLPSPDTCPIPKGDYSIKDFSFDAEKIPSAFPGGEYKLILTIFDGHKAVSGLELEVMLTTEE